MTPPIMAILGTISTILAVIGMLPKDVKKIRTIGIISNVWDLTIGMMIGAMPSVGTNSALGVQNVKAFSNGTVRKILHIIGIVSYVAVAVLAGYDIVVSFFAPAVIVGWVSTGLIIAAFSTSNVKAMYVLSFASAVFGFAYGYMIGYYPMCVARGLVTAIVIFRLFKN